MSKEKRSSEEPNGNHSANSKKGDSQRYSGRGRNAKRPAKQIINKGKERFAGAGKGDKSKYAGKKTDNTPQGRKNFAVKSERSTGKAALQGEKLDYRLEIALQTLIDVEKNGKYMNLAFKNNPKLDALDKRDRAYVMRILYGVVEKSITLEWLLKKVLKEKRVKPWLLAILKIGVYQIYYMRIEDEEAIQGACELCGKYVAPELKDFVSAVLTKLSERKGEYSPEYFKFATTQERLSVTHSFPEWIIEMWLKDYGVEIANQLLKGSDKRKINLRVCQQAQTEAVAAELEQQGILCQQGVLPNTIALTDTVDVERLECYRQGLVTVQGIGSMMTVHVMQVERDSSVLDACAAPGGKSFYICEKTTNSVKSWDIHEHRVELIRKGANRLKLENIEPECRDSSVYDVQFDEKFDRILLDVPCSGLGMVNSKPDIKNRIQPEEIQELAEIQARLLDTCSRYLKPGGLLTYSTCTVSRKENEDNVRRFLEKNPNFEMVEIDHIIPDILNYSVNENTVMLLPSQYNADAFFMAVMRKKESNNEGGV